MDIECGICLKVIPEKQAVTIVINEDGELAKVKVCPDCATARSLPPEIVEVNPSDNQDDNGGMYGNIGNKIKGLAKFIGVVGIIACCVTGIVVYSTIRNAFIGFIIAIVGSIISWISTFVLYGFGELVDNSSRLVKKLDN